MGAFFDDAAVFKDENAVDVHDGGKTMGNDKSGLVFDQIFESILDELFGFAVETAGGFIENQNFRIAENGTGDSHSLALAAGKFDTAFTDKSVIAVRKFFNEFMAVGHF